MTKKIRYSLIAVGFVFFLIAAPLIVLYVRGVSYDFKTKNFVKTGILAVQSSPSDAEVFLDGKLKLKKQGDIRFLLPAEYQVSLKKDGYFDWTKRLTIQAGQVTWASPSFGNINLFLKNPPSKNIADGVTDFYGQNGNFIYLVPGTLTVSSLNNPDSRYIYPLPTNIDAIAAEDDSGKNFALTDSLTASDSAPTLLIFNRDSGKSIDISPMFAAMPKIQFGSNGGFYALSQGSLYSIDLQNKTKTALFSGVSDFYFQGGSLYFTQKKGQTETLLASQDPFSDSQVLLAGLPQFAEANLFVTFEKEVLLLGDGRLYLVNSGARNIADNVSAFSFNPADSVLSVIHSGELDYYDPAAANLDFVTRSSEPLANPRILTGVGNAFYLQGNKLMAIELDARDSQNQYQLYQGADIKKFFVDDAGKNVLVLDGGALKSLVIR